MLFRRKAKHPSTIALWMKLVVFIALFPMVMVLTGSAQPTSLIPKGANWSYLDDGSDQGSAWRGVAFDDSTWAQGPAELGYGDGDEATIVSFGPTSSAKHTTTYFRHTFVVDDPAEYGHLSGEVTYDDGAVVYLNGQELLRVNLPEGIIDSSTFANGAGEYSPAAFNGVPGSALVAGNNVLAVEIHQGNRTSSDISFNFQLTGHVADLDPPVIESVTPNAGPVSLLNSITVTFSEEVTAVTSDDLLLNGLHVDAVIGGPQIYTFTFPQPFYGTVEVTWDPDHAIQDTALPPNPFDGAAAAANWQYTLADDLPPTVVSLTPIPSLTVRSLTQIELAFSEAVTGVEAGDLLINGDPAESVATQPGGSFLFGFPPPPNGIVEVAWAQGHGITDLASDPNPFAGGSWSYTLDPTAPAADLVLNEISAANLSGWLDEFGNAEDWIEIWNRGDLAVDLAGWSLSDDQLLPAKWVFPSYIIAPGEYLVVFTSGRDIKAPTANHRFHTNFRLGVAGEDLGLYSPDSPRQLAPGITGSYPEQRNDHSYGLDSLGDLRYFATPTPGERNGSSTITGVVAPVHFNVPRGYFVDPFRLVLTSQTPGAEIRYTTDGSEPTLARGQLYQAPLTVTKTTLLRAAAFRPGRLPSLVETHSYLFNLSGTFRSLPIISIVTDENHLWGPTGILGINGGNFNNGPWAPNNPNDPSEYHNPQRSLKQNEGGAVWERPTSLEWIEPDNKGFQTDAGLRVHGSNYTRPRYQVGDKFAFKVYFRNGYGPSRLNYPWFPGSVDESLDEVVLRDGHNDDRNPFITDELIRRLHGDMGQAASHGTFGNLLLNGVPMIQSGQPETFYFNPVNRVKEGFLQAWHGGGLEWDIIAPFGDSQGGGDRVNWNAFESLIRNQSDTSSSAWYAEIERQLDLVNFVDYLLVNIYGATWDWPHNNWRAARERTPDGIWRFYVWDAEGAFYTHSSRRTSGPAYNNFTDAAQGLANNQEIATFYQKLRGNPEFRLLFADRIQRHFFNGGALTEEHVAERFNEMRSLLSQVIVNMDRRIVNDWVPNRRTHLWSQFTAQGLLAGLEAPEFGQHGGQVRQGSQLTVSGPVDSTIYYTTDGTDPRVRYSGAVADGALAMAPGNSLTLDRSMILKARANDGALWSALTEARFEAGSLGIPLRITEIQYNPSGGNRAHEFLEIQNVGTASLDLSGLSFEGITFTFPAGTFLAPGAFLVLTSDNDPLAFSNRYPGVRVDGLFSGSLANDGERIAILDRQGNTVVSVDYRDDEGWPIPADGAGYSLEIVDPWGAPDEPANWRASGSFNGSPGQTNPAPPAATVRLNEIMADNLTAVANNNTFPDWIELHNPGSTPVDLSGWSLTDDGNPRKFVFPEATAIAAEGYLVVWCDAATNSTPGWHTDFSLNREGENLFLFDRDTNRVDALSFGLQLPDFSIGRIDGKWTLTTPTPQAPNEATPLASVAVLSLNEWMPNPLPGEDDWVELYNQSTTHPVALQGLYLLAGEATHPVTSLSFIGPNGFAIFRADQNPGPDHLDLKLPALGGTLSLYGPAGGQIDQLTYPSQIEGVSHGRLPDGSPTFTFFNGSSSPGAPNLLNTYTGPVINEILARNQAATTNLNGYVTDWVELVNPGSLSVDLAGMSLSVGEPESGQWFFPSNTIIPAQGYLVVYCEEQHPASTNAEPVLNQGHSLNGESGGVYLFRPDGQLVDSVEYGFQVTDLSIGRAGSQWDLLDQPTLGTPNSQAAQLGATRFLRLNEWMADPVEGDDWVELYNTGLLPLDLHNLVLTDDPSLHGRADRDLAALSYLGPKSWVRVEASGHPEEGRNHVGFSLGGQGDTLRIYGTDGTLVDSVHFGQQGRGVSQGRLPDGQPALTYFESSPTPAAANFLPADIIINEVISHTDPPLEDAVELHNPTDILQDVSGWYLSDSGKNLRKHRIPDGTLLPPGGYWVVYEHAFNDGSTNAFALNSARGGTVWLSEADPAGNFTGYRTRFDFDSSANGASMGPYSTPFQTDIVTLSRRSLGADNATTLEEFRTGRGLPNANPRLPNVVVNEILYHPAGPTDTGENTQTEFVELSNRSGQAVRLFDPAYPTNTWRLRGGIDFDFPGEIVLPSGGFVVIVGFNPESDPGVLAAFVQTHDLTGNELILGPFQGQLSNAGETIRLLRPDTPQPLGDPDAGYVPYLTEDQVRYQDTLPWPTGGADGEGLSLQKQTPDAYGNNPLHWFAGQPTPGSANGTRIVPLPQITTAPADQAALPGTAASFNVQATGTGPLSYQWRHSGQLIPEATSDTLLLDYVMLHDHGDYDVIVANSGGSILGPASNLRVIAPPEILTAPESQTVEPALSNLPVIFTVTASGPDPLLYQWWFNGEMIPGANSPTLTLNDVAAEHDGQYEVTVSNLTATKSAIAHLTVLVKPTILVPPQSQTAVAGSDVSFSVTLSGSPTPFRYQWSYGALVLSDAISPETTMFLTLPNVSDADDDQLYRIAIANDASPNLNDVQSTFTLTVLNDTDLDGLPDAFESAMGFPDQSLPGDADEDGDGLTNREEYLAGTDYLDPLSYLSVDRLSYDQGINEVEFHAVSNRTYSVQYRNDLSQAAWSLLGNAEAHATNRVAVMPDRNATNSARLYRLVTPAQPGP